MKLDRGLGVLMAASLGLLFVAAPGCGRVSVEDVCEALQDCPTGEAFDCQDDGLALERAAEDEGCGAQFDAYIECIDAAGCSWQGACLAERDALESCVGDSFPS